MINRRVNTMSSCAKRIELINTLRKLWSEHTMWTRSFIISTAADLGDLQYVTQRLLRNPKDFAAVLRGYYGFDKANRFEQLLTEHLTIAAGFVNEAKAGDTPAANESRKNWYRNADEIAEFLASINPFWSRRMWQAMLHEHLKITEEEAVLRLTGQYSADVALYDEIEAQGLEMADFMAEGIINQFNL
ncbi:MAG: hypothetical protein BWY15_01487 [Firmicutes bacterium ADurb.Bin193]|nr:MAG: hypothetical protein BWY15_01487 [Firmicutes bacterium ADurb.Bin193]